MPYVQEFLYRGRDPQHEAGQEAAYHVVLADWSKGPDGVYRPQYTAPLTPAQSDAMGFPLPKVLGEVAAAALMAADTAKAVAKAAQNDRDTAVEARQVAEKQADDASKARDAEISERTRLAATLDDVKRSAREAADAAAEALADTKDGHEEIVSAALARINELTTEIAELKAPDEPAANPVLNRLTFGLFGN